jgi:hypothetical protein
MTDISAGLPWLVPQLRSRLDCPADEVGLWIDRVCTIMQRAGVAHAYLSPQRGSLLSNITVLENLWLPLAWRKPLSSQRVQRKLSALIDSLPGDTLFSSLDRDSFLRSYPDDLPSLHYCWAVLLRAALLSPRCLVIDAAWFFPLIPEECCVAPDVMEVVFGSAAWLAVVPYATTLAGPWDWTRVSADGLELSFLDVR